MNALDRIQALFGGGSKAELAAEARKWVDEGATLLDVRTPEEFGAGHLVGSLNIPVQVLSGRLDEVSGDRVVVYCRSGMRSARAAKLLAGAGKQVLDLGSIDTWR